MQEQVHAKIKLEVKVKKETSYRTFHSSFISNMMRAVTNFMFEHFRLNFSCSIVNNND